jgi:hypothetical protein
MSVLKEASALSNLLLLSVSDHFELCLAKCRTSSRYVKMFTVHIMLRDLLTQKCVD